MQEAIRNTTPWVDKTILKAWDKLIEIAPHGALPVLLPGQQKQFEEYGHGHYGHVIPTQQEDIVLKLTTDQSEADFISLVLNDPEFRHVRLQGMVQYHAIFKLEDVTYRRRPVYAIWREEAHDVGFALSYRNTPLWAHEMMRFKDLTHIVQAYVRPGKAGSRKRLEKVLNLRDWAAQYRGEEIARWLRNPEKSALAIENAEYYSMGLSQTDGIYHVGETLYDLLSVNVMLADVHLNNIGKVIRDGYTIVVITDPGHMVLLDLDKIIPPIEEV